MMGFWQPLTNLRGYISQNPPWVSFFLCLLALAVSFIGLACYCSTHTLPNPDTVKDWNHLLSSLSQYQLCTKANGSSPDLVSPFPSTQHVELNKDTSLDTTKTLLPPITHLHLKVPLTVTTSADSSSLKDFALHTNFRASQLNLGDDEIFSVTVEFLSENDSHTCLTLSAPTNLLPLSPHPPACSVPVKNTAALHVDAGEQLTASNTCYKLHYKNEPAFRLMLTKEEQHVVVRHLIEVSVFLLGVCLILCVVASLSNSLPRRYHWNGVELQDEALIDP